MKNLLITKIREQSQGEVAELVTADPRLVMASGVLLDPSTLTLGFARRFASYKRPTLLLQDMARLKKMLNDPWRPVQIIFAGKAHQDDQQSKLLLQQVFNASRDQAFGGRIAFVEDYDELLAQYLVHGVDVWVNNPLPPMEASGTSGMKATLNGVPQLSILDALRDACSVTRVSPKDRADVDQDAGDCSPAWEAGPSRRKSTQPKAGGIKRRRWGLQVRRQLQTPIRTIRCGDRVTS